MFEHFSEWLAKDSLFWARGILCYLPHQMGPYWVLNQWEAKDSMISQSEEGKRWPHRALTSTKSQWLLLHQTMLLDLDENVVSSKVAKFETHLHNVTSPAANCREAHKYFLLLTTWSRPEFWVLRWALRQSLSVFGSHSPWWESLCSFQNIPWDILQE